VLHEMGHQWFYAVVARIGRRAVDGRGMTDFSSVEQRPLLRRKDLDDRPPGVKLGYRDSRRLDTSPCHVCDVGKSWDFGELDYGVAAYSKPVVVLSTLKNILGPRRWPRDEDVYQRCRFKHPRTEDFIAVTQEVSGRDLKWFFDQAVYGKGVLDYAVESVHTQRAEGKYQSQIILARREVEFRWMCSWRLAMARRSGQ